jgi:hypothetical protein
MHLTPPPQIKNAPFDPRFFHKFHSRQLWDDFTLANVYDPFDAVVRLYLLRASGLRCDSSRPETTVELQWGYGAKVGGVCLRS